MIDKLLFNIKENNLSNKMKLGVATEVLQQEFLQGLDTYSNEDQKILSDQFISQMKVRIINYFLIFYFELNHNLFSIRYCSDSIQKPNRRYTNSNRTRGTSE